MATCRQRCGADLSEIQDLVEQHQQDLLEAWDEFFNG
jgi:hypothetical protein